VKKTLFSLAFIAASGAYVAAANHLIGLPRDDDAEAAVARVSTEASGPLQPSALPVTPLPAGKDTPTVVASARAARPVAEASLHAPAAAVPDSTRLPVQDPTRLAAADATRPAAPDSTRVAAVAPTPVPPLPRPRPTPPPSLAVETATTSNVAADTSGGYRDGTYTGTSENAYYGRVQVQVTVTAHQIASVKVLDFPQDRRTSRYINSQALPLLKQEVIAADSANVDTISGATLTSEAYIRSLNNALSQAGGANA